MSARRTGPRRVQPADRTIGTRLRALRLAKGLSQTELGKELGVTFQQVQKYEHGTNRISGSSLVTICKVLEIKPEELLGNGTGVFYENPDLLEPLKDALTARAFMTLSKLPRHQRNAVMHSLVKLVQAFRSKG